MRIAVKYCGGCNSKFDRVALVEQLKSEFSTHTFFSVTAERAHDFLLIVCGCHAACAARRQNPPEDMEFILRQEADLEKLRPILVSG